MILKFFFLIIPILVSVAFITLMERKILGLIGFRLGPNKVSFFGFLQPISDALKLAGKQSNFLSNFSYFFYYFSSFSMLFSALVLWSCFQGEPVPVSYKFSMVILLMILGYNSLNSILSGWSTFSKYSLLGSVRTVSQLISYEVILYMILFFFIYFYSIFNFYSMSFLPLKFSFLLIPVMSYIWLPSILAELNRTPYDFSEGESELVSGFNTEFGSSCFTLIFLAEYSNIIFLSMITFFMFYLLNFNFFILVFFFIIWIRSVLPRFRYDKLMMLSWKFYLPLVTLMFMFYLNFLN